MKADPDLPTDKGLFRRTGIKRCLRKGDWYIYPTKAGPQVYQYMPEHELPEDPEMGGQIYEILEPADCGTKEEPRR